MLKEKRWQLKNHEKIIHPEQNFKGHLIKNQIQPFSAVTKEEIIKEGKLFNEWTGELALPFQELHINARDGFLIRIRIFNPEANTVAASRIAKASGKKMIII